MINFPTESDGSISFTQQMYEAYLSRRQDDLELLKKSIEVNKPEGFSRLGHQLLGNARTYGFLDLEPLAQKLERIKDKADLQINGPKLLRELDEWIVATKQTLNILN